jgi:hypothetical protein
MSVPENKIFISVCFFAILSGIGWEAANADLLLLHQLKEDATPFVAFGTRRSSKERRNQSEVF